MILFRPHMNAMLAVGYGYRPLWLGSPVRRSGVGGPSPDRGAGDDIVWRS